MYGSSRQLMSGGGSTANTLLVCTVLVFILISVIILQEGLRACEKDSSTDKCKNLRGTGIGGTVICGVLFFGTIAFVLARNPAVIKK